jgi:hypothetical protein
VKENKLKRSRIIFVHFLFYCISGRGKGIEAESWFKVAWGWERWDEE